MLSGTKLLEFQRLFLLVFLKKLGLLRCLDTLAQLIFEMDTPTNSRLNIIHTELLGECARFFKCIGAAKSDLLVPI